MSGGAGGSGTIYKWKRYELNSKTIYRWDKWSLNSTTIYKWNKWNTATSSTGITISNQTGTTTYKSQENTSIANYQKGLSIQTASRNLPDGDGKYIYFSGSWSNPTMYFAWNDVGTFQWDQDMSGIYWLPGANQIGSTNKWGTTGNGFLLSRAVMKDFYSVDGPGWTYYTLEFSYSGVITKGSTIQGSTSYGQVTSTNSSAYPANGASGSYWYVSAGSEVQYSKGSTSYGKVESESSTTYPNGSYTGGYWYDNKTSRVEYSQGAAAGTVYNTNRNAYPDNGKSGSYWYVFDGEA